ASGDFTQRVPVQSDDEIGDLACAVNDLTHKLEQALATGARERERLRAVLRSMGDGVIAFDGQLRPQFRNAAAKQLLAKADVQTDDPAAVLGLSISDLQAAGERAFVQPLGDALVHVHVTAIRKRGEVEGYVATLRDVTEQERLQAFRRDFVANVSHELRTPLTSVKTYVEALQEGGYDEPTREKFLRVIAQETDRMVRLTRELLQLSGLESGNIRFAETLVKVDEWLLRAWERFRLTAQAQGVTFQLKCQTNARLRGDPDWLDRLIDNLVSNALKFTASGGRVEIRAEPAGVDSVRVVVADTGMGIPEEDVPHVFERFYRVDKARSRRRGGTGLGLALAREITERHGGTISLTSRLNEGTTVTVVLPLAEEVTV
ncbi:MAG: cell wall metabolism sensor histidine kinase WalK, partial [Alicyclobacillus sp.]|nr:cell wall metabolism sensor histidine kinase WalK [Alicyclobacillus sp.]